jgi:hypothetical protein
MMADYDDFMAVENGEDEDGTAMQKVINAGQWSLQGSFGRSMMAAIEAGAAMLGKTPARDYWGNYIPSRDQVEAGTKGSYEFVAKQFGPDYADRLAAL